MSDIPDTYTIRTSQSGASRPRHNEVGAAHHKIDTATEAPVRVKVFTSESVRQIQAWRAEQNLTQKQLDQRCAFPSNTMNGLESRRVGPTTAQLQRLNSLLKAGLSLE